MSSCAPPPRKRILFLIPSLSGGGAQRVFSVLLRHLDRGLFEPHLALLKKTGAFIDDIPEDVVVYDLKVTRVRYVLPSIVRLSWKLRPKTILSTLGHLNIALIASKPLLPCRTRLIIREASIASVLLNVEITHSGLWFWLYKRFYPKADKIVCLSESIADDMISNFNVPSEKVVRIYNPIDVKWVIENAGIGTNPYVGPGPHLVGAGRLTREKGFDILIDCMPTVLTHFPNATLTILGQGALREELLAQASKLGLQRRVSFLEFQQNPWVYLKHADLFILPSRYEGMPNVLLEALTLNTRVIAAACPGGIREIQQFDDRVALVPPEDPKALAQAIIAACQSPRFVEGEEHLRQRLRVFDAHNVALEYSKLL